MILVPEDKVMLQTFLDSYLFNNKNNDKNVASNAEVELIIRPECNQKCEYCYITKYGKDLYPIEKRISNIEILNNIHMLLDYFYENKCFVKNWEFFAGDLFYDDLFFDIIDIFYDYFKKIQKNYPEIYNEQKNNEEEYFRDTKMNCITMPCNLSFCHSDEKIEHFRYVFEKMLSVNTIIFLSYSTDGLYGIDHREKSSTVNQEFFDKTFKFCKEFDYGCHPMIAPENIDNAIDNYKWWREMYDKYFSSPHNRCLIPCMLEVRNDGWTNEKIEKYKEFLEYAIQDRISVYDGDIKLFTKQLFASSDRDIDMKIPHGPTCMDPISLLPLTKDQNGISCTLGHSLCINCTHLTLVPCHRLAYDIFEGGEFKVEDNKIIDIEPFESINGYLNQMFTNRLYEVKCQTCENRFFCMQGCHGSQFETNGDPNIPITSVCNLLTAKIEYLLKRYHELGVFNILFNDDVDNSQDIMRSRLLDILIKKGYKEYEQYRKK